MSRRHHLAELQLAIMQVLWDRGESTVSDVRDALNASRPLAYTTVGTMLSKMEANGQVAHRSDGRVNIYYPLLERDEVNRSMLTDLTERLFRGDVTDLLCTLLDGCEVSGEELQRLKQIIAERQKEQDDAH
ncbi:MAG: BlaI/MecI/CopY family transcriptional regulator [Planctomycetaceae bacterium]|nr:BlaI/MecI/CopY family transcriptional regulator [Planctomycetaceae bacterium]MCB9950748.1 BlaI/MecI/CopY family transcriptional regulator [Planctomycetaceae bacterium]